jgi:hypothetical protein
VMMFEIPTTAFRWIILRQFSGWNSKSSCRNGDGDKDVAILTQSVQPGVSCGVHCCVIICTERNAVLCLVTFPSMLSYSLCLHFLFVFSVFISFTLFSFIRVLPLSFTVVFLPIHFSLYFIFFPLCLPLHYLFPFFFMRPSFHPFLHSPVVPPSLSLVISSVPFSLVRFYPQYSVVGTATGYGLDDRGVGVRGPVSSGIFSALSRWAVEPQCLLYNGYRGLLP